MQLPDRLRRFRARVARKHHDRLTRKRALALTALVRARLPVEYDHRDPANEWPLFGAALLSRATTTLQQVMRLQGAGRNVDAATLVRSLYEHTVHIAWLAADPTPARLAEWRRDDLARRIKAENDARERGYPLFSDGDFEALKRQVEGMPGNTLYLEQLATVADAHWSQRLPEMAGSRERTSLRGMYTFLFRYFSATAHPSYMGLNFVVEDVTPTVSRVVLEGTGGRPRPYGLATVVYATALLIAAESLGWPDRQAVLDIFDRYPTASTDWP